MSADQSTTPVTDWWDRLYDGLEQDLKTEPNPTPVSGQPGGSRIPDWRTGPVDLSKPEAEEEGESEVLPLPRPDVEEEDQADEDDELRPNDAPAAGRLRSWVEARRPATVTREHVSIGHRSKVLLYNGGAAALGHSLDWTTDGQLPSLPLLIEGWLTECGTEASITAALLLGLGVCVLAAHTIDRWSRGWWGPLHFLGRVPLASAVLALGLYSPAVTSL